MGGPSVYRQVMAAEFDKLALPLRQFHALAGTHVFHGDVQTEPPAGLPARLLARCLGTPLARQTGAIRFELRADGQSETWTRHFPGQTMVSRLHRRGPHLVEHLGLARLTFALSQADGGLHMRLVRLHFLGIPCPVWLMPQIVAQESGGEGRLHFEVRACVPGAGLVAGYQGHLEVPAMEAQ